HIVNTGTQDSFQIIGRHGSLLARECSDGMPHARQRLPALYCRHISEVICMDQNALKQAVAEAALQYVPDDAIIGVGTGSTANCFIDALARRRDRIRATVASSEASAARLRSHGIKVVELNQVAEPLAIYV